MNKAIVDFTRESVDMTMDHGLRGQYVGCRHASMPVSPKTS